MNKREISRRDMVKGSAALAALVALGAPLEALAAEVAAGETVVHWLDQPPPAPLPPEVVATQLVWEELGGELTPNEKFFTVQHYGQWLTIREQDWRLTIDGLVAKPLTLTLAQLRARASTSPSRWSARATTASPSSPAGSARRSGPAPRSPRCCARPAGSRRPPRSSSGAPIAARPRLASSP